MRTITTIILLLNILPLFSQSTDTISIDRLFEQYSSQSPGVSVLVSKGDSIIYKRNFGQANLEYGNLITSNTIFNAASLAKQFVAFGIYLLKADGRLSLVDNVKDYILEFPDYGEPIKISHLLSHTSGIRDQRGLLTLAGYRLDDFISHEDVLQLILRQKELNFQPGDQFEYSHSNYTLLAHIIETITGLSLNEYMKLNVFIPLEMNNTFFLDNSNQVIENRAYSYGIHDGSYVKVNLNYQNYGPTNLMTSVDDLFKWILSFSNNEIASQELIREFDAIAKLKSGNDVLGADLGEEKILGCKGQFYRHYKGCDFYSHGGSLGGFRSFLGRFPNEQLSIIILGNVTSLNTYSTALKIADIVLGLKIEVPKIEQPKNSNLENEEEDDDNNYSIIPEHYIGNYYNDELNSNIRFASVNNHLNLSIGKNKRLDFTIIETDKFMTKLNNEVTMEFIRNDRNEIKAMKVSTLGVGELFFEKIN